MTHRGRPALLLALFSLILTATAVHAGEGHMDFATALEEAADRDVPIVVDFYAVWCGPCKAFDRDYAEASSGIVDALQSVVFTSIDAEKGEGIELAKTYGITVFPSYVMLNSEGEMLDKWMGYGGPKHFLDSFAGAMEDTRTLAAKRADLEANPTAALAAKFGRIAEGNGEYDEAIALFRQAEKLDPSSDQGNAILNASYGKIRRGVEGYDVGAFVADARAIAMDETASTQTVVSAAQMVGAVARGSEDPDVELPFLEAALGAIERDPEGVHPSSRSAIEIAGYLRVRNQPEKAVVAKKATLREGWEQDADQLNAFAWWCFENDVNLEEAETLARRGVEVALPGKQKAMVADTAAEICNARGDCLDAVKLIEMAMAEDPENTYYRDQLERFQKILETTN